MRRIIENCDHRVRRSPSLFATPRIAPPSARCGRRVSSDGGGGEQTALRTKTSGETCNELRLETQRAVSLMNCALIVAGAALNVRARSSTPPKQQRASVARARFVFEGGRLAPFLFVASFLFRGAKTVATEFDLF